MHKLFSKTARMGLVGCAAALAITGCNTTEVRTVRVESVAHLDICLMYIKQKDYPNAIRECQVATQTNPTAAAYSNLGVAYIQVGKNNLALTALQNARRLDPADPYVRYNLAALYSLLDKTDLALESLDTALNYGFKDFDALRWDRDLDNVRAEPEFRRILEKHRVFIQ